MELGGKEIETAQQLVPIRKSRIRDEQFPQSLNPSIPQFLNPSIPQ